MENVYLYSTAHIQVYKKTQIMIRASRNFAVNSHFGLVRHKRKLLASDNWWVKNAHE